MKILLILLSIISLGIAFVTDATGQTTTESGATIYNVVEEMPMYPGGNAELTKFISKNIQYPAYAEDRGIQGKVIIKFCVTAEGSVSLASVLKGVDPDLDQEAMRIIKRITKFIPGKKAGIAVPVWYMVPISFSLKLNN
jgi:protein TonB